MKQLRRIGTYILLCMLGYLSQLLPAVSQTAPAQTPLQPGSTQRDGQHDFDFERGAWKIHLSRLQDRLAGSTTWVEFDGTSHTRKVWDGRANLEEFETDSPMGHIEGLTLRVYNPQTHQGSIYWANSKDPGSAHSTDGRRVFRSRTMEGQVRLCTICLVGHHPELGPLRAVLLG